jgi:C1A family cysteine protease
MVEIKFSPKASMKRFSKMNLRIALILLGAATINMVRAVPSSMADEPSTSMDSTRTSMQIASQDAEVAPKAIDLRPLLLKWGLDTRVQGHRDTCSVFVVTEALEYALASKRQHGARLSVEFLNWAKNQTDHSSNEGGFFSELWAGFEPHGICPEAEMPYQNKFDPDLKPSKEAIAHAKEVRSLGLKLHWIKEWDPNKGVNEKQLAEIKKTLARRWPVCGGFLWPKSKKVNTNLLKVIPRSKVIDGHSLLLVGYRDDEKQPGGGVFLFRNTAGRRRDGRMTYEYALTYMNDTVYIDDGGAAEGGAASPEHATQ